MDVLQPQRSNKAGRIGKLATLPVFFDLSGKPVLVAGGSEGAAWKAELLAACGAEVHVFCPADELSEGFKALIGSLVHHDDHWEAAYFKSFALAVGDCEEHEAKTFHDRAVEAGIPVNVIDKPDYCQFKFGSIVNRSPVVIGISTDGAAPILGQAIRRRIESLLPPSLRSWAELAQTVRAYVTENLPSPAERRSFWERFVDRAFGGGEPQESTATELVAEAEAIAKDAQKDRGRVALVGAGPGEAELLTLKAIRALQAADVILFDSEVSPEILELARREAKRISLDGAGSVYKTEEHIRMTAAFAQDCKRVVRLMAGDPSDHESAEVMTSRLVRQGIAVEVIPGIAARRDVRPAAPNFMRSLRSAGETFRPH
jgi:uroporphyrin-III C-methyltransferase/precorrin-2 dehydrogenase/sirohydrochlorin ferrochelatase